MRTLTTLHNAKLASSFFCQVRHAEVVNTPASTFFGGHHNNWGKAHMCLTWQHEIKDLKRNFFL